MAAVAIYAAMSSAGEKSVHPFFTRVNGLDSRLQDEAESIANDRSTSATHVKVLDGTTEKHVRNDSKGKDAKGEGTASSNKIQKTLSDVVIPRVKNTEEYSVIDAAVLDYEQGEPRTKRRRTYEEDMTEDRTDVHPLQHTINGDEKPDMTPQTNVDAFPTSSPDAPIVRPSVQVAIDPTTPPKKMLRLKANGRFSSPVTTHVKVEAEKCENRAGRRRVKDSKPMRSLLVKVVYGKNNSDRELVCNTISRILKGEERFPVPAMPGPTKRAPQNSKKATHPFFLSKAKGEPQAPRKPSPRKTSAVTPGKLRRQTLTYHNQDSEQSTNESWGSGLLRDRLMVRHPGARDPPFPHSGQVHVRNLDDSTVAQRCDDDFGRFYGNRKYKETRLPFPERDCVIFQKLSPVMPDFDPLLRPDGFHNPLPSLHVPQRRLLCGIDILQHASGQLRMSAVSQSGDAEETSLPQSRPDLALQRLLQNIPTTLTAFDNVGGEAFSWTQKYAPKTVGDVLQPTKVMTILKDWLKSMRVRTVSSTTSKDSKIAPKLATKPKKKRKKRNDDLDDFLVNSDEEVNDMNEVVDAENGGLTEGGKSLKSIVQASHEGVRLSNAVLISGPSGCGKTAAAYAVAKELDFKVFEISSSERRNGKDVVEKVGDMVENHLVKHHGADSAELSSSEDPSLIDEAFRRDLESGRQGKMNAFFKPQATPKPPTRAKPRVPQILESVQEAVKKPHKEQQQSLILLEEVDVLFRDDKDFWTAVLKLIVDSKRPFIMTCNDEDIVPLQAMKLHAILRLTPPSEDLTVDYILLLAAAEGHLLDRRAVLLLYRSKGFDLRATITQLDFWCQMGIGDPRGGLSWIYQRWPPGSDVDGQGRQLRVVSDGTYTESVGLIPDTDELSSDSILYWAWTEFDVDPVIALGWDGLGRSVDQSAEELTADPAHRLAALKSFTNLTDSLSVADLCCASGFLGTPSLDMTTPDITDKARGQYISGLHLLQADECVDYTHLDEKLHICISTLAFQASGYLDDNPPLTTGRLLPYMTAERNKGVTEPNIGRRSLACFDAIAVPEDSTLPVGTGMIQSAFDGPLAPIALDLAPYARSIVYHDRALEERRDRIEQFTSDGRRAKRARTTRAARSALEGGQRATTRKERWFSRDLDYDAVLATGGDDWPRSVIKLPGEGSKDGTEAPSPSATSTAGAE